MSGKDELLQHIQACETYQVKAEEQIKDCGKITGRIPDLTITDERNRWVLIIENKNRKPLFGRAYREKSKLTIIVFMQNGNSLHTTGII